MICKSITKSIAILKKLQRKILFEISKIILVIASMMILDNYNNKKILKLKILRNNKPFCRKMNKLLERYKLIT